MTAVPIIDTIVSNMGKRRNQSKYTTCLFGKTKRLILALLYGRSEESFYLRQLVRTIDTGQGAVQRELKKLTEAGLIERHEQNQQVHYKANKSCPIFAELKNLILKTEGLAGIVKDSLAPISNDIDLAFIYGSQANGTAVAMSDIDLLIVGNFDDIVLHRHIRNAEEKSGRAVNYTHLNESEFARRRTEKNGFIARVLRGAKIVIFDKNHEV